jgi:hypothetical protein
VPQKFESLKLGKTRGHATENADTTTYSALSAVAVNKPDTAFSTYLIFLECV